MFLIMCMIFFCNFMLDINDETQNINNWQDLFKNCPNSANTYQVYRLFVLHAYASCLFMST